MKPTAKQILKWTSALRSGEYEQGQLELQSRDGFCCLGVACKVFIPKSKLTYKSDKRLAGRYPDKYSQPSAPEWLHVINEEFNQIAGLKLSDLNDDGVPTYYTVNEEKLDPFTFNEIADFLEAVYVHKVLD